MGLSVCLVTTFFPPQSFGGDGIHVERLAEALARRGHEVTVVHSPGAYNVLRPGGARRFREPAESRHRHPRIRVLSLGGLAGRIEPFLVHQTGVPVLSRRFLRRTLAGTPNGAFDVIHYHNVSLAGGVGVFALGSGVKLFTAHEYWLGCPTHLLFRYNREICTRRTCVRCTLHARRPPQWWRYTRLRDRYLSRVDAMIFPSALTQSVYRDLGVTRPGEVMRHFLPDDYRRSAADTGTRPRDTEPYCLYVGRLDAVKGLQDVLPFFARGEAPMPLWIAGEGPQGKALLGAFGANPRVRFLGHQGAGRLATLYRDAAAVILPSASLETFGQVIIEAFAHRTPALSSRSGAGRELIEASGAGYTYATLDELRRALVKLADADLRNDLGKRGLDYLESAHSESAYMQRYEALIEAHRT